MTTAQACRTSIPLPPFVQALRLAAMATPSRTTRSILEYALVTVSPDAVKVRSGDSEVNVELTIPLHEEIADESMTDEEAKKAYDEAESVPMSKERIDEIVAYATADHSWKFLLPPATTHAALVDLRDETVTVEQDGPVVVVRGSGAKDVFRFKQADVQTYPGDVKAAYREPATVDVQTFLRAVKQVRASTGLGEPQRYVTTGALVVLDGEQGTLVGTDCASMAISRFACKSQALDADAHPVLVPKRALDLMTKILGASEGEMSVRWAPNAAEFRTGGVTFVTGLLAGKFPSWSKFEQGCLKDTDGVTFDKAALLSAIKRVAAPMDLDYQPVRFEFDGKTLTLNGKSDAVGEFESEVPAPGMPASVSRIDVSYLTSVLPLMATETVEYRRNRANGYVSVLGGEFGFFLSPLMDRKE